jgi:putative ABC transport system ATP-binding protein
VPLIEIKQVHKYYYLGETRIVALRGVDLEINRGEFLAIWGPSGSGKSTLCNVIGMIDDPSSGEVLLEGRKVDDVSDDGRSELRNRFVGFIFQTFNLIPVLSALENVMLPLQIRGDVPSEAEKTAKQLLSDMGMADYIQHRPHKLSGGQQQRVAIARALITNPELVIADEPTANLDSETAIRIVDLMRQLNREGKTTFIFSTHDQRLLGRADRQIHLRDGLIVEDKSLAQ